MFGLGGGVQAALLPRLSDCADVHCTLALQTITGLGPLPAIAERSATVPLIVAQLQLMLLYLRNVELSQFVHFVTDAACVHATELPGSHSKSCDWFGHWIALCTMYHTHPFFTHDSVLCTAYMGSTSSLLAHSADTLTMESSNTSTLS